MTPTGSQESLRTQKSNPDCHCGCHEIEHDLHFINEKTQTEYHENHESVHNQETNSLESEKIKSAATESTKSLENEEVQPLESEHAISTKHSEVLSMNKPSAFLLKQIYTEIKVCRCFEKYANHKKLQQKKNHPSYENIVKKEEIQQKGVFDDDDKLNNASIGTTSHQREIEVESPKERKASKKQSKETVKSKKSFLKPMKSQIDLDSIENESKKEKKKSKDKFVDIELVGKKII